MLFGRMESTTWLSALLCFLSCIYEVNSFGKGPPVSTCLTQFPKHKNTEKQTGEPPFKIVVDPTTYEPSQKISVVVEALSQKDNKLKGLIISAHRQSGNTEEILGSFTKWPLEKMKTLDCLDGKSNVAIHKNANPVDYVDLEWSAALNYGDIEFRATVLENFTTFWSGVTVDLRAAGSDGLQMATYRPPVVSIVFTPIKWSECGKTRGCFFHPPSCTGSDCDTAMTFVQNTDGTFTFELAAKAEGYVAVSVSKDKLMGDDETFLCTADGDRVTIQHGFVPAHHIDKRYTKGFSDVQIRKADGKITCRFTRPKITTMNMGRNWFNLTEPWFLQMAWGYTFVDTDVISKHTEAPIVTNEMVQLTEYKIYTASSSLRITSSISITVFFFFLSFLYQAYIL